MGCVSMAREKQRDLGNLISAVAKRFDFEKELQSSVGPKAETQ